MSKELQMLFDDTNNSPSVDDIRLDELPAEVLEKLDAAMYPEQSSDAAA